MKSLTIKPY